MQLMSKSLIIQSFLTICIKVGISWGFMVKVCFPCAKDLAASMLLRPGVRNLRSFKPLRIISWPMRYLFIRSWKLWIRVSARKVGSRRGLSSGPCLLLWSFTFWSYVTSSCKELPKRKRNALWSNTWTNMHKTANAIWPICSWAYLRPRTPTLSRWSNS